LFTPDDLMIERPRKVTGERFEAVVHELALPEPQAFQLEAWARGGIDPLQILDTGWELPPLMEEPGLGAAWLDEIVTMESG
jgi:hypothetical protein